VYFRDILVHIKLIILLKNKLKIVARIFLNQDIHFENLYQLLYYFIFICSPFSFSFIFFQCTSILLINVLVSNYFSREGDDDFFESVKTWALLGLNWMQAIQRYTQLQKKGKARSHLLLDAQIASVNERCNITLYILAQVALICFLIYAISFLLASTYLTIGSLSVSI